MIESTQLSQLLSRCTFWYSFFHSQCSYLGVNKKNSSDLGHFVWPSRPERGPLRIYGVYGYTPPCGSMGTHHKHAWSQHTHTRAHENLNMDPQQHNTTCNTRCYTASFVLWLCYAGMCYRGCNSVCYTCVFLSLEKPMSGFIRYETCFIRTPTLCTQQHGTGSVYRLQSLHNVQTLGKRIHYTV